MSPPGVYYGGLVRAAQGHDHLAVSAHKPPPAILEPRKPLADVALWVPENRGAMRNIAGTIWANC
jgi:hypothetical protein